MTEEIVKNIWVKEKDLPVVIPYQQGTNAIPLKFVYRDLEIPQGAKAQIYMKKPSGKEIFNTGKVKGNEVTFDVSLQMSAEYGDVQTQVQVRENDQILNSFPLIFEVCKSPVMNAAFESTNEYDVFDQMLKKMESATNRADGAADDLQQSVDGLIAQWKSQWEAYYQSQTLEFGEWSEQEKADFTRWAEEQEEKFDQWSSGKKTNFEQWSEEEKANFEQWFSELKVILSGDVAGNLQNEIDELKTDPSVPAAAAKQLNETRYIEGIGFDGTSGTNHYAECNTAAGTREKAAVLNFFKLTWGSRVIVKFVNGNTAANPTLNINGTGAFPITYKGNPIPADYIKEKSMLELIYDLGNKWHVVGDITQSQVDDNRIKAIWRGDSMSGATISIDGHTIGYSPFLTSDFFILLNGYWEGQGTGLDGDLANAQNFEKMSGAYVIGFRPTNNYKVETYLYPRISNLEGEFYFHLTISLSSEIKIEVAESQYSSGRYHYHLTNVSVVEAVK